jgi:hypothetical protein
MRLREAHRSGEPAGKHRPHEAPAQACIAEGHEEVGGARGQRRVGVERDVRAREHGRAGLRHDERQLQTAVGPIECRGGERSLVVRGERLARFGNGPGAAVQDARLIPVAGGGVRRELCGGDLLGGVEHAVEEGAVVVPEALPAAQAFDMQDVVELEVEVTSRYQHARHSVEPGL